MRIFVIESLGNGGMIHYAYQLCNALAQQGAEVRLITSTNYELHDKPHDFEVVPLLDLWAMFDRKAGRTSQGKFAKWLGKFRWQARRGWRALKLLHGWVQLTRYVIRERPDIVQFGKIQFPFETFFLWWMRRSGLILTDICHEFEQRERGNSPLQAVVNRLYASVYPLFGAIFFHAKQNQARFVELFGGDSAEKSHVIPHGMSTLFDKSTLTSAELRQRYQLPPDAPVVLFFGTLSPSKGLPDLIDGFAQVTQTHPTARLLIAGYPTKFIDMEALRQQISGHQLDDVVQFDPRYIPIDEVPALFNLASFAVYPYRNSTQSGALQIAMTHAKAVIATRCGGLPEAVEEGKSGLLVEPRDPTALAEAMQRLLADDAFSAELGAHGKHLAETRYSWEAVASRIVAVYEQLLAVA